MMPADVRLLSAKDLFVSQSAMTGESLPVEKFADHGGAAGTNPLELDNLAFMGTNVVSGSATRDRRDDRRPHLLRRAGAAGHGHRPHADGLPGGRQPGQLAADPLHAGDDAASCC